MIALATFLAAMLPVSPPTNAPAAVRLGWDPSPSANVVGYNVYYGANRSGYTAFTGVVSSGAGLSCIVSNLSPGVAYSFAATAYGATGESDFSPSVTYTTQCHVVSVQSDMWLEWSTDLVNWFPTLNGRHTNLISPVFWRGYNVQIQKEK